MPVGVQSIQILTSLSLANLQPIHGLKTGLLCIGGGRHIGVGAIRMRLFSWNHKIRVNRGVVSVVVRSCCRQRILIHYASRVSQGYENGLLHNIYVVSGDGIAVLVSQLRGQIPYNGDELSVPPTKPV